MSRLAALLLIARLADPAAAAPASAEEVVARHRAATSIGPIHAEIPRATRSSSARGAKARTPCRFTICR